MIRRASHRGLTLIELLAAAVILSAMAAAVWSVHRDAIAAARRAEFVRAASAIVEQWERLPLDAREHWSCRDDKDRQWSVRTEPIEIVDGTEDGPLGAIGWECVIVEVQSNGEDLPTSVLRLRRPCAQADMQESAR